MKDWDEEHLLFAIRMADEPEILVRAIREIAEREIDLSWGRGRYKEGEVAAVPSSWQAMRLVAKENLR